MKMKKMICLLLGTTMAFILTACGSTASTETASAEAAPAVAESVESEAPAEEADAAALETEESTEAETPSADYTLIQDGTLSVGVEIGYPPFEDFAEDGVTPIGYDIDFANALAEKLGLEVNFINTAWDGIFSGIGTNYDVVISAVTITDERKETMAFSEPYINSYQSIVVAEGSELTFTSLNDLDGKSVALQKETTSDALITDLIDTKTIDATVVANEKVITCFTQLTNGEVDCVLCDSPVADGYLSSSPGQYVKIFQDETSPEQFGVAMSKDNTGLTEAINTAIAELESEGFFEANIAKWFGAGE